MAALREEMFGMGFLKISAADFMAGNLRGDRQHGNAAAVAIVQAIDQVQIARTATPGADCQASREMGFGARSERTGFLVPHVNPLQAPTRVDGIDDPVQRVAGHSINALNARFHEYIHNQIRYFLICHMTMHSLFLRPERGRFLT